MTGALWPRRMVRLGLLGVAVVTLARGTTGHDWYTAGKLTAIEIALAVGFSEYRPVAYRWKDGDTLNMSRAVFPEFGPPVRARQRILAAIGDGVMLGAGVGGTVFFLMLLGAVGHGRRGRTGTALELVEYSHRHFRQQGRWDPSPSRPRIFVLSDCSRRSCERWRCGKTVEEGERCPLHRL